MRQKATEKNFGLRRELSRTIYDFGLGGYSRQDDNVPFKAILTEVGVEGEGMVESVMVDQGKAGAIDKAKVFVIVSHENRLGCLLNRFASVVRHK